MDQLAARLLAEYERLDLSPPDWAYRLPSGEPLHATIPFVGRDYTESTLRLALYASAENLAHYERAPETVPDYLLDGRSRNRHRETCECAKDERPVDFWPKLHIGPVENGSLLCAALFVLQKLGGGRVNSPMELLERLLVANVGKFSIAGQVNLDYIGTPKYLRPSLALLEADLTAAAPDVLMIPRGAYQRPQIEEIVARACPDARVVPIYQFNSTVVNTHLAGYHERGLELRAELAGATLGDWMERLGGYREGYAYRYLAKLEEILCECPGG